MNCNLETIRPTVATRDTGYSGVGDSNYSFYGEGGENVGSLNLKKKKRKISYDNLAIDVLITYSCRHQETTQYPHTASQENMQERCLLT